MLIKLDTTHSVGDKVINQYFEKNNGGDRQAKERFGIVTAVTLRAKVKKIDVKYDILDEEGREHQVEEHELKKFVQ